MSRQPCFPPESNWSRKGQKGRPRQTTPMFMGFSRVGPPSVTGPSASCVKSPRHPPGAIVVKGTHLRAGGDAANYHRSAAPTGHIASWRAGRTARRRASSLSSLPVSPIRLRPLAGVRRPTHQRRRCRLSRRGILIDSPLFGLIPVRPSSRGSSRLTSTAAAPDPPTHGNGGYSNHGGRCHAPRRSGCTL